MQRGYMSTKNTNNVIFSVHDNFHVPNALPHTHPTTHIPNYITARFQGRKKHMLMAYKPSPIATALPPKMAMMPNTL